MAMATKLFLLVAMALLAILMVDSKVLPKETHPEAQYHLDRAQYGFGSLKRYQCPSQCSRRCSQTQYKKPCLFFCNKCCAKCLCVPPGYYGNKGVCPCYNNWKTKRGGPKCP
ncbi:gibberellin-regulated protein 6-like [Dioscorea cayenensis subsp. rotundata]|uniref:Gibberellin-regulated protein 6-like n=1 Tax=Dioscorea cayennensis subsp. rotundata TaxID=55577 RepID=A0AB40BEM9_DIOCR|nr:gibberellin-regulated protein 6-like [Dioscorea cayenensis subsp. rotundata]